jgi:hypothetical protein
MSTRMLALPQLLPESAATGHGRPRPLGMRLAACVAAIAPPVMVRPESAGPGDRMTARRTQRSLAIRTAELAVAAPQVVAHRVARMALAGPTLSERDRKEFRRMGAEKTAAFTASWNAMALQAFRAQQALWMSFVRSLWSLWLGGRAVPRIGPQLHNAMLGVLTQGMGPVHRTATANAKRLARTRLR